MTKRQLWMIWLVFAICLLGLMLALGRSTRTILRLQNENLRALKAADMEETVRAAIWRMDSLASTLVYQESLRPATDYEAFTFPEDRLVFTGDPECPVPPMPSPLLDSRPEYVTIYFTCRAAGAASPQVPGSNDFWQVETETDAHRDRLKTVTESCACEDLGGVLAEVATDESMRALWVGDGQMLVFARRVQGGFGEEIQAAWIDWPTLSDQLQQAVIGLLPNVVLDPILDGATSETSPGRMLAALPVSVLPGLIPARPGMANRLPVGGTLALSWGSLALAAVAIGLLLWGLLRMSKRRGDFATAVTHELRTPLTGLQLNTELLASGVVTDPDQRQEVARLAHGEAKRLAGLVENVLAYAQVERGQAGRRLETVSLAELVRGMSRRLQGRASMDGYRLEVVNEGPDTEVQADAVAVEQVLTNFVDNACKYGASPDAPVVWLVTLGNEVEVRDGGKGVPADERKRLFRAFQKSSGDDSTPGVGLGLALSRKLARQCGGDVGVADRTGFGGVFWLRLPPSPPL